jgi:hypothetical protein
MKYARVINIELKSPQDLEIFYKKWEKWLPENMPKAVSRTLVRTSPNSTLMMAVYESEEIAEQAREVVQRFFELASEHMHDVVELHGEVMLD